MEKAGQIRDSPGYRYYFIHFVRKGRSTNNIVRVINSRNLYPRRSVAEKGHKRMDG